ncbi:MAG: hypothetical protein QW775_02615 [Ignisphaera sp.]|uniref:ABC transporter permease n=1 Tax=Ignisphaera aggregans TaxID=334771 RepID=A0A7C4NNC3_9CREN
MIFVEEVFDPFYLFLLLTAIGDIVVERSGVLNLGIDGFIVFSIAFSYTATIAYNSTTALLLVILCGLLIASVLSFFINFLHSSHVLTGLVLNMIFYGLSAVIGDIGLDIAAERRIPRTLTSPLPLRWYYVVLITIAVSVITWFLLYKTRIGTSIRACGFNPRAADHLGVKVWRTRYLALVIGYVLIALGGYTYTLFYKKSWSTYIGIGYGFLALALAMSSLWHPLIVIAPVAIFSYLLRSLYVFQLEYGISQHILSMIPYIAAIAFVTTITASPLGKRLAIPKALGEIYFREERAA